MSTASRCAWAVVSLLGMVGCGSGVDAPPFQVVEDKALDRPLFGATEAELDRFADGDLLFDVPYREADGLGPLYIRTSCASCHGEGARGPGGAEKMVIIEADGFTPSEDQSALAWGHTVRPYFTSAATQPLVAPEESVTLKKSLRLGPPIFGRGYMEAISDSEIERVEHEQSLRTDGISGRINRVAYQSEANPGQPYHAHKKGDSGLIGRFGLKARIATSDEFTADAFQGDMGITSPMRTDEPSNPDGVTDDAKPGFDVDLETINAVGDYVRLVEIPTRDTTTGPGLELFQQVQCGVCHVPRLKTRADYPIPALAGIDAPVFTDLLLHDMGDLLADGMTDGSAEPREWRTAPLIGLKYLRSYLHDGRASTVEEAIVQHQGPNSEANDSVQRFQALSAGDKARLIEFLSQL